MSNWERKIDAFSAKLDKRIRDVHANTAFQVRDSIALGSNLTGSPGQPIDSGYLRASWMEGLKFDAPLLARISTNVAYAPAIEENERSAYDDSGEDRPEEWAPGPIKGASEVGGPHSVKLTRVGWDKIVNRAVKEEVHD